jgi:phosphoribosylglycinamide formyltransferase 1
MVQRTKVAVLISGRGSNMEALVRRGRRPTTAGFEIALVLANKSTRAAWPRGGRGRSRRCASIRSPFGKDREAHERAIDTALRERGVQVIALAGYMRILTPFLVDAWEGRMLNIHPSLLPAYPGLNTHARAITRGRRRGRLHRPPGHGGRRRRSDPGPGPHSHPARRHARQPGRTGQDGGT